MHYKEEHIFECQKISVEIWWTKFDSNEQATSYCAYFFGRYEEWSVEHSDYESAGGSNVIWTLYIIKKF